MAPAKSTKAPPRRKPPAKRKSPAAAKRARKVSKPPPEATDPVAELLEESARTVRKGLVILDEQVTHAGQELAAAKKEGRPYDSKLASHVAWMQPKLTATLEAVRKLEQSALDAGRKLSPEDRDKLGGDYLIALPADRRAAILSRVSELADDDQGVL